MVVLVLHVHLIFYTMYYHQSFHQMIFGLMMLEDGVMNMLNNTGWVNILTGMCHQ